MAPVVCMNKLVPRKKNNVLKPNQPNQQKTQVWKPLFQRSSFEHACSPTKKHGLPFYSDNQVGTLFTIACHSPWDIYSTSIFQPWHCVGQLVLDGKRSQQYCLIRQCCSLSFLHPIAAIHAIGLTGGLGGCSCCLVGWLVGWLVG